MNLPRPPKSTVISNLGETYESAAGPALAAMLTLIDPTFGVTATAIGGLVSYGNSQRSKVKFAYFAKKVEEHLNKHDGDIESLNENLYEAIGLAIQGVESSVTTEKIERFARIISGHIIENNSWDETATALRAISSLEDIHIQILSEASYHKSSEDQQARFYISTPNFPTPGMIGGTAISPSVDILEKLDGRNHTEVRMFCMELMSKGILHDNGQGRFDKGPVFTLTEAAFWLLAKIEIISENKL